jgi:hypothetical protein
MGPTYLPSDVFFQIFPRAAHSRPFPTAPLFFFSDGQFVLCGGSQFILGSIVLRGDW